LENRAGRAALTISRSVRLDIQQNREIELLRFRRGEVQLINKLEPEFFERLIAEGPRRGSERGSLI